MAFNELSGQALRDYDAQRALASAATVNRPAPQQFGPAAPGQKTVAQAYAESRIGQFGPAKPGQQTVAGSLAQSRAQQPAPVSRPMGTGAPAMVNRPAPASFGSPAPRPALPSMTSAVMKYKLADAPDVVSQFGNVGASPPSMTPAAPTWGEDWRGKAYFPNNPAAAAAYNEAYAFMPAGFDLQTKERMAFEAAQKVAGASAGVPSIAPLTPAQMAGNGNPMAVNRPAAQMGGVIQPGQTFSGPMSAKTISEAGANISSGAQIRAASDTESAAILAAQEAAFGTSPAEGKYGAEGTRFGGIEKSGADMTGYGKAGGTSDQAGEKYGKEGSASLFPEAASTPNGGGAYGGERNTREAGGGIFAPSSGVNMGGAPGGIGQPGGGQAGTVMFPTTDATGRAPGSTPTQMGAPELTEYGTQATWRDVPRVKRPDAVAPERSLRSAVPDMPANRDPYANMPGFDQKAYSDRYVSNAVGNIQREFSNEAERLREDAALRGLSQQGQGAIERGALTRAEIARTVAIGRARNEAETNAQQFGREDAFKRAAGIQQTDRDNLTRYELAAKLPAQLTAADLANEATSLAVAQARETYPALVRKINAGADLTDEEVSMMRWTRENAGLLAAAGFFANIAPAVIRGGAALVTGGAK